MQHTLNAIPTCVRTQQQPNACTKNTELSAYSWENGTSVIVPTLDSFLRLSSWYLSSVILLALFSERRLQVLVSQTWTNACTTKLCTWVQILPHAGERRNNDRISKSAFDSPAHNMCERCFCLPGGDQINVIHLVCMDGSVFTYYLFLVFTERECCVWDWAWFVNPIWLRFKAREELC